MTDLVTIANSICDRVRWRSETLFLGLQWSPTRTGFRALEMRNTREGSTTARPVCNVRQWIDGYSATCMCCGKDFDVDGDELTWDGRYPTGLCCCSAECRTQYQEDAITVCECCGLALPTGWDVRGNQACALCRSRAFRAHHETTRGRRLDTPSVPGPTDIHGWLDAAPEGLSRNYELNRYNTHGSSWHVTYYEHIWEHGEIVSSRRGWAAEETLDSARAEAWRLFAAATHEPVTPAEDRET